MIHHRCPFLTRAAGMSIPDADPSAAGTADPALRSIADSAGAPPEAMARLLREWKTVGH